MFGGLIEEIKIWADIPSNDELALQRIAKAISDKQSELAQYDGTHVFVDGWMQRHISAEIRGLERQQRAIQERIADRQRVFGR